MKRYAIHRYAGVLLCILFFFVSCTNPSNPSGSPETWSVSYDANGATSGNAPTDTTAYLSGATVTVLGNTGNLVKSGYMFAGWNTKADGTGSGYAPSEAFAIGSANVTLFAQWTPIGGGTITVTTPSVVTVSLTVSATVASGSPITATVVTSDSVDSFAWYLDGNIVSEQTTDSFSGGATLAKGPHTLMVVVRKNSIPYSASTGVTVQ